MRSGGWKGTPEIGERKKKIARKLWFLIKKAFFKTVFEHLFFLVELLLIASPTLFSCIPDLQFFYCTTVTEE